MSIQPACRFRGQNASPVSLFIPLLAALVWLLSGSVAGTAKDLETGFAQPPASARPWVYWFWLDGNVSREGITADLEAMHRVGIGGALLMDISQEIPQGPIRFASPEWRELFKHAVNEAGRLGLQINLHNAAGWTGSGGPWITPDLGMQ
ncbi:MAG TPA: glycosyl hydrolase, partial [Clostridia bacterium]|nr:glycosyl hydrolase [Clostridia bacterium]